MIPQKYILKKLKLENEFSGTNNNYNYMISNNNLKKDLNENDLKNLVSTKEVPLNVKKKKKKKNKAKNKY